MWLERFIFCRSSCGPTTNYQSLAKRLAAGSNIPLGKYLLGSAYHLMHQVLVQMLKNEPIGTISGPWWLIQLWLNLYLHKTVTPNLRDLKFPSSNYAEDHEEKTCRCISYGEAASAISIELDIGHSFKRFYRGFSEEVLLWLPYDDEDNEFEFSYKFQFDLACTDEISSLIFNCLVKPCALPVEF